MNNCKVKVNGEERTVQLGLIKGESLYSQLKISNDEDRLFLDIQNEVDIPIKRSDFLVIEGNENFATGKSEIEDNPNLKKPISIKVDEQSINLSKPKITGKEIKKSCKDLSNSDLYIDLLNFPDQLIKDDFTLIVIKLGGDEYCFITVPVSDDNIIDTEECSRHNKKPPKKQDRYKIKVHD